jgi:CelD/BcsL family acetyltransferase involved in cellulose biosynthesis
MRDPWDRVVEASADPSLFLTSAWFSAWWEHLAEDHEPCIFELNDESSGSQGFAPLMRRAETLAFPASREVTDYCDFVFPASRAEQMLETLLSHVAQHFPEIQSFELINLPSSSPTLSFLPELAPSFGFHGRVEKGEVVPVLKLPDAYQEYLSRLSRKNRHELRRKIRRTESLPDIRHQFIKDPALIRDLMPAFIAMHRSASPDKENFWRKPGIPEFFKTALSRLAEHGMAALHVLYSGRTLAAVLITGFYGRTVYFYNIAYAHEFAAASPGYFLIDRAIRQAITDGQESADFLRGDERYKFEFGAQIGTIYNLILNKRELTE